VLAITKATTPAANHLERIAVRNSDAARSWAAAAGESCDGCGA